MKNSYIFTKTLLIFSCFTTTYQAQTPQQTYLTIEAQVIKYDNKDCKGSLEIFTHDGLIPFTFSIDGGKTFHENKIFENLCEGKYFVQAKDATGKLGLTLMHLTPNTNYDIFNEQEAKAIRDNTIKDLLLQRDAVIDNWVERRTIEYKLSKLNVTYPPIIISENLVNDTVHLTYKMIVPSGVNISQLFDISDRLMNLYKEYIIDIKINTTDLTATVIYKKQMPDSKINEYFNLNGFANLK